MACLLAHHHRRSCCCCSLMIKMLGDISSRMLLDGQDSKEFHLDNKIERLVSSSLSNGYR